MDVIHDPFWRLFLDGHYDIHWRNHMFSVAWKWKCRLCSGCLESDGRESNTTETQDDNKTTVERNLPVPQQHLQGWLRDDFKTVVSSGTAEGNEQDAILRYSASPLIETNAVRTLSPTNKRLGLISLIDRLIVETGEHWWGVPPVRILRAHKAQRSDCQSAEREHIVAAAVCAGLSPNKQTFAAAHWIQENRRKLLHKMKLRMQSIEPGNYITPILTLEMFRELNQLILPGRSSRHCQTEDGRNILGDTMAVYRGLHFDLATDTDISMQRLRPATLKNDVGFLFFMSGREIRSFFEPCTVNIGGSYQQN